MEEDKVLETAENIVFDYKSKIILQNRRNLVSLFECSVGDAVSITIDTESGRVIDVRKIEEVTKEKLDVEKETY